jgi:hypothetical protein
VLEWADKLSSKESAARRPGPTPGIATWHGCRPVEGHSQCAPLALEGFVLPEKGETAHMDKRGLANIAGCVLVKRIAVAQVQCKSAWQVQAMQVQACRRFGVYGALVEWKGAALSRPKLRDRDPHAPLQNTAALQCKVGGYSLKWGRSSTGGARHCQCRGHGSESRHSRLGGGMAKLANVLRLKRSGPLGPFPFKSGCRYLRLV